MLKNSLKQLKQWVVVVINIIYLNIKHHMVKLLLLFIIIFRKIMLKIKSMSISLLGSRSYRSSNVLDHFESIKGTCNN